MKKTLRHLIAGPRVVGGGAGVPRRVVVSGEVFQRRAGVALAALVLGLDLVVGPDLLVVGFLGLEAMLVGVDRALGLVAQLLDQHLRQERLVGAGAGAAFGLFTPNALRDV